MYSFDHGSLPKFFASKVTAKDMARAYSGQVGHVISLLEHEIAPDRQSRMLAAAANREFVKTTPIAAFRKGSLIPGWYD